MTMWALLRRLIDPGIVDDIIGDLTEERERRSRTSRLRANLWYWRQALAVLLHISMRRLGDSALALARTLRGLGSRHHLRQAFRSLRNAPWFTATIAGVMGLALALATTVFAVVDGVLFKPLPYPNPEELTLIHAETKATEARVPPRISLSDLAAWRETLTAARFTAFRISNSSRLEDVNDLPFGVAEVQPDFFDVIGVRPLLGGFQPEHFMDESNVSATIVSYALWQTRFGGALDIVGTRVTRGTAAMLIVGVMPREFVFPARTDAQVLMPLVPSASERTNPRARSFEVIARLPSPVSYSTAIERIELGMATAARKFPPLPPPPPGARYANVAEPFDRVSLTPLAEHLSSRSRPLFLAVALSAAALVLLGCVNVSGLMAARSLDRRREIELRRALGAQTSDIAGLIAAEAAWLMGAGTALGLALAYPLLTSVLRVLPTDLTLLKTPAIDWRVATFAVLTMVITVAGISIWPISRGLSRRGGVVSGSGARGETALRPASRSVVIALQIAIGLVLTIGGALVVGSMARLWQDDVGMSTEGVTAIELRIPAQTIDRQPGIVDVQTTRLLEAVRAMPGVREAGTTDGSLFRSVAWSDLAFRVPAGARSRPLVNLHGVSGGFFETVQLRLLAGRLPSPEDLAAGRDVLVLSESVARAYWPGATAIGQHLQFTRPARLFEVIGEVADARLNAWDDSKAFPVYASARALDRGVSPSLLIRTSRSDQGRVLAEALRLVNAGGPELRAIRAMTLGEMMSESVRPRRFQSWLFGSFATAALLIVGVGILGLMAMTMARRVREIGVRMALGATRQSVVALVLREQAVPAGAGLIGGAVLCSWLVPFLRSYLYESTPYDPTAWAAALALVLAMAVSGAAIPAIRAGRVEPARALRSD
jgi:putative ABC transport system permease protein